MGWSVIPHAPYNPDLAPSNFYLFGLMKECPHGYAIQIDDVKSSVKSWARKQAPDSLTCVQRTLPPILHCNVLYIVIW